MAEARALAAVGVGSPGDVDERAGTVAQARNLPDWKGAFPLGPKLSEMLGTPVRVANDELLTVREAMRELNRLIAALESGELEKVVLTQRNQMRAVVVSLERFSELERRAAA